jgi:hypothetical protein
MKVGICYVCPVIKWKDFESLARRFVSSFENFPPEYPYEFHLVCNGGNPNAEVLELFSSLNPIYHEHDNTGWDIGAFQKIAPEVSCDLMLFLGTNSHFRRAGGLARLMEAYEKFGPGLYGTAASFDISPHLRTNGFLCDPQLVAEVWAQNSSHANPRHHFEVGKTSLTRVAAKKKLPIVLVTWDGFFLQKDWRKAKNIYRRGDQSNCLIYDRHHEVFEAASESQKIRLARIADGNKLEYYRSSIQVRLQKYFTHGK